MDRDPARPLTPDEAKARLRAAAAEVGLGPWVRRHPLKAVATGVAVGYLLATAPPGARRALARRTLRILPYLLLPRAKAPSLQRRGRL